MSKTKKGFPYSYEENEKVTVEIEKILADNTSELTKIKKLRNLKERVSAPISKHHIDYYLNKLIASIRNCLCRFICNVVVMAYLVFTVCRVFWFYYPSYNPFTSSLGITIIDLIVYLYVIPVIMIIYYLIRRFLR